ncbi:putative signal transducing protein [Dyella sp. KRB-257]|uniref:putative signal transducing protein n=1 Tax=Dyella sp. KRB-257 TaxID=3400915 RepID=UPI003C07710E
MHIAYRAETLIDAHLVKDALERAEIPAFVTGEYLTGGVGQLPAMDYVLVMVPESARAAAAAVVGEVGCALAEARQEASGWTDAPGTVVIPG